MTLSQRLKAAWALDIGKIHEQSYDGIGRKTENARLTPLLEALGSVVGLAADQFEKDKLGQGVSLEMSKALTHLSEVLTATEKK